MGHEVVDGAARFRRLQAFIGRHAVPEGIHNTDLEKTKDETPSSGRVSCSYDTGEIIPGSGCGSGHGTKARGPSSAPSQRGQSHPGPSSPPAPPQGSPPAACRAPPSSGTSASWWGHWRPAERQKHN